MSSGSQDEQEEARLDHDIKRRYRADEIWRYSDRETNREHLATLEILRSLAKAGFFLDGGLVARPLSNKWEESTTVPELADAFTEWHRTADWVVNTVVNINGTEHRTDTLTRIAEWIRAGRVSKHAQIWHPLERRWMKAVEIDSLASVWPPKVRSGCMGGLLMLLYRTFTW